MRTLRLIAGNAHRPKMEPELRLGTCVQKRSKHTGDARSSGLFSLIMPSEEEEGEAINYSFAMISEGLVRIVLRMFHSTMAAISTMTMSEPPMQEMRGETAPT